MATVYILQHSYEYEYEGETFEEIKTIAIYSTREKAQHAANHYKVLPGFKDYPDGFSIGPYVLDEHNVLWDSGFEDAYSDDKA